MIFQDPTTSLNPCFTIGFQLARDAAAAPGARSQGGATPRRSNCSSRSASRPPRAASSDFPHQMSGGMNQRVMIAMAIACNPRLLIADEPTTALDVTIQAQILDLLRGLQRERGMALILVTHNMGVVAEMARRVAVMYAGQVVEERAADELFAAPQHPYTAALLAAMPERSTGERAPRDDSRRGAGPLRPAARAACSRRAAPTRPATAVPAAAGAARLGGRHASAATFRWAIRGRDAAHARAIGPSQSASAIDRACNAPSSKRAT